MRSPAIVVTEILWNLDCWQWSKTFVIIKFFVEPSGKTESWVGLKVPSGFIVSLFWNKADIENAEAIEI